MKDSIEKGEEIEKQKKYLRLLYDDDDNGIFWTREFGDLGNWNDERNTRLFYKTLIMLIKI